MSCRPPTERGATARLLIIQTGSTLADLRPRRGDFADWFTRSMGVGADHADVVRVDIGEVLPAPTANAGIIVTGSHAMVSERLPWSERTAAWLRGAVGMARPVLGVCYGHQLLAHALGGRVDYHPCGREIGTVDIERLPAAAEDPLLRGAPDRFRAHSAHQQSVLELPSGAVPLARSAHDPHHAVRYAPNAWGLQFHPEFSVDIMRSYVRGRQPARHGDCPRDCCATRAFAATPGARRLLHRFRAIVAEQARDPVRDVTA